MLLPLIVALAYSAASFRSMAVLLFTQCKRGSGAAAERSEDRLPSGMGIDGA